MDDISRPAGKTPGVRTGDQDRGEFGYKFEVNDGKTVFTKPYDHIYRDHYHFPVLPRIDFSVVLRRIPQRRRKKLSTWPMREHVDVYNYSTSFPG